MKHIVFDIDGTLIDTEIPSLKAMAESIRIVTGAEYTIPELMFALGIPGTDSLQQMGIREISEIMEIWPERMRRYQDEVRVYDGVESMLEALYSAGYSLGLVTSKTRVEFENEFCPMPISRYFSIAVVADDTILHKPSGDPLRKYMELTGTTPEELTYVGDTVYDCQCSIDAGVRFILADWGSNAQGQDTGIVCKDASTLPKLI